MARGVHPFFGWGGGGKSKKNNALALSKLCMFSSIFNVEFNGFVPKGGITLSGERLRA